MKTYPKKKCQICRTMWSPQNRYQAQRNKTCSQKCASKQISKARTGKPIFKARRRKMVHCAACGTPVEKNLCHLKRVKNPTCSQHCKGILRGQDWARHGYKGRAAWTEASKNNYKKKMSGPNNPAWKGGVTYWRKHGNYKPIKYVRCPVDFLPMARKDGYVMEHRLLMAQKMGRCLTRTEVVHHKNHNPQDNTLSNLELFQSNQAHKKAEGTRAQRAAV